jgi:hypothetical protein
MVSMVRFRMLALAVAVALAIATPASAMTKAVGVIGGFNLSTLQIDGSSLPVPDTSTHSLAGRFFVSYLFNL